jgi:hypothetical protein
MSAQAITSGNKTVMGFIHMKKERGSNPDSAFGVLIDSPSTNVAT